MDFSTVCRTCLDNSNLKPLKRIFDIFREFSTDLHTIVGIKVEINDSLPQNMCIKCFNFICEAIAFRNKCKNIERQLFEVLRAEDEDIVKFEVVSNCSDSDDKIQVKAEKASDEGVNCASSQKHSDTVTRQNSIDEDNCKPLNIIPVESTDVDAKGLKCEQILLQPLVSSEKANVAEQPIEQAGLKNKRVKCIVCGKNLSINSIDYHMAHKHPGTTKGKVQCPICEEFVLKGKMSRHTNVVHNIRQFKCGHCPAKFTNRERFQDHYSGCTARKLKKNAWGRVLVECKICHKVLTRNSLPAHKACAHAGRRRSTKVDEVVCEHCGRKWPNKHQLRDHCRAKHGHEKLKCASCDYQASTLVNMRNHERKHRGEKPYQCEACGAKFHASHLLNQHRESHRTEKLMKCDQCPAAFKRNITLHMHRTTCHSKVTYRCPECGRGYQCRQYVVKHMRRFHKHTGPVPRLEPEPRGEEVDDETDELPSTTVSGNELTRRGRAGRVSAKLRTAPSSGEV